MAEKPQPPWLSHKVWYAGLILIALVLLAGLNQIELTGEQLLWLAGLLIGGQALEGAATAFRGPRGGMAP